MYVCKKCGSVSNFMRTKGTNVGVYCSDCKAWIKWVGKSEQRLLHEHNVPFIEEDEDSVIKKKAQTQNKCRKCGSTEFFTHPSANGIHIGLYCDKCGTWIKWLGKRENGNNYDS